MKIIFLDIDGVLNTSATWDRVYSVYKKTGVRPVEIDEFRVEYLKQIIDETGAKIVLSSTWRSFFEKNNDLVVPRSERGKELYEIFNKYGIEIYDYTTKNNNLRREEQITMWINEHDDIDSFVVIDDESSDLIRFIGKELIKTSRVPDGQMLMNMDDCLGLCQNHIEQVIGMLNQKNKILKK